MNLFIPLICWNSLIPGAALASSPFFSPAGFGLVHLPRVTKVECLQCPGQSQDGLSCPSNVPPGVGSLCAECPALSRPAVPLYCPHPPPADTDGVTTASQTIVTRLSPPSKPARVHLDNVDILTGIATKCQGILILILYDS